MSDPTTLPGDIRRSSPVRSIDLLLGEFGVLVTPDTRGIVLRLEEQDGVKGALVWWESTVEHDERSEWVVLWARLEQLEMDEGEEPSQEVRNCWTCAHSSRDEGGYGMCGNATFKVDIWWTGIKTDDDGMPYHRSHDDGGCPGWKPKDVPDA